jgi:protein arginine kinase activator
LATGFCEASPIWTPPSIQLTRFRVLLEFSKNDQRRPYDAGKPAMKCQKCPKQATLHITDILPNDGFEEHHLCEQCAHEHLYEPQGKKNPKAAAVTADDDEEAAPLNARECPECGIKFVEFRNSGRLGCPHDYDAFSEELNPLLENIHGDTRHCGKSPRRLPQSRQHQSELTRLRRQLQTAVSQEAYEEAAKLRDQIRQLEES